MDSELPQIQSWIVLELQSLESLDPHLLLICGYEVVRQTGGQSINWTISEVFLHIHVRDQ